MQFLLYLCTLFRVLREILCMHDGNIQMANEIKHTGTVIAIEDNIVRVKIEQSSACSACQAKAMCTSTDKKEKIIEVAMRQTAALTEDRPAAPDRRQNENREPKTENLQTGDTVEVIIKQRMGWKAVVIAYIVPLIVLVGTLAVLDMRMESEALAGVIALGVTGVYFIVLRLFRDKLQREFSFSIRKTE